MIRDQIVDSCQSNELRKKILKEKDLTLKKIQEISRASDLADLHCTKMVQNKGGATQEYGAATRERNMHTKIDKKPKRKQYYPRT